MRISDWSSDVCSSDLIEDLDGAIDHVVCMNVLSNMDNFHRPFERMLRLARKSVILRESLKDGASYSYVVDNYLDAMEPLRSAERRGGRGWVSPCRVRWSPPH